MVNVVHSRSCEHIATQGRRADHLLYVVPLTHPVSHLGRKTQDSVKTRLFVAIVVYPLPGSRRLDSTGQTSDSVVSS